MDKRELIRNLKIEGFSSKIIRAFLRVKREHFIADRMKSLAYENTALPLEEGATISQPYTIAVMLELLELKRGQKILEIGSGSGYVIALILEIIKDIEIFGIEISKNLADKSKEILKEKRIKIFNMNGSNGLLEYAPFDRILISASSDRVPSHLYGQLRDGGIIVAPVKNSIVKVKKKEGKFRIEEIPGFSFVPLRK